MPGTRARPSSPVTEIKRPQRTEDSTEAKAPRKPAAKAADIRTLRSTSTPQAATHKRSQPAGAVVEKLDRAGQEAPMLECSSCLRGYHTSCLSPPLSHIPKGDWQCPACVAGTDVAPRAAPITAREYVQAGILALVRIESLWRAASPDRTAWFTGRWFIKPEETHTGRQKHHAAREVFLTQDLDENEAASLLRPATVCDPATFAELADAGDDVFLYEYEYDTVWKRFRRRSEAEDEEAAAHEAAARGSDSDELSCASDDERDGTFQVAQALEAEGSRRRGRQKGQIKRQGGEDWAAGKLGADHIPSSRGQAAQEAPLMSRARAALALTAAPKSLACREKERAELMRFVEASVVPDGEGEARGRCLYLAGVPGTGKTALVLEVMAAAKRMVQEGQLAPFQFVEINALRLPTPHHAYVCLHEALTGERAGTRTALNALEEMFRGSGQQQQRRGPAGQPAPVTVVLLDEMDLLVTRNQTVLYNLFEWPTLAGARLAVIGVANTFDMPERVLPKIASRLGSARVPFQPYTKVQLATILQKRLADVDAAAAFEPNSIDFASRKVAGVTGDLRRALELCRKAAEVAQREGAPSVRLAHIDAAVRVMFGSAHMRLLRASPLLDKVLLAALLLETKATGRVDAVLTNVARRVEEILTGRLELSSLSTNDVVACASRLATQRLLLADCPSTRQLMRLSLNVPQADVVHVLTEDSSGMPWMRNLNF
ncbi:hypothetical protein WJX73_002145 [Symbiochloris irregularis]|uniref:Origin recognition complex subunit 1 n=1 Tax=Symbiochloris irregularis TaxID=706552 RepID=A0AAW1P7T4_9CHLO